MNFVHGNPLTCISIGLAINRRLVLGIISVPMIGHTYTAIKGKGAFLNSHQARKCYHLLFHSFKKALLRTNPLFTQDVPNLCQFHQHSMSSFFIRKLYAQLFDIELWYTDFAQEIGGKAALKILLFLTTRLMKNILLVAWKQQSRKLNFKVIIEKVGKMSLF